MQFLNQTIVFLNQQNNDLKQKVRKLESICKNLVEVNNITESSNSIGQFNKGKYLGCNMGEKQKPGSPFDRLSIMSPKQFNNNSKKTSSQQFAEYEAVSPKNSQQQLQSRQNSLFPFKQQSNKSSTSLKQQIETLNNQIHQLQLQSLQKSTKLKSTNQQLYRCKQQLLFIQKSQKQQIQNLKKYYEIMLIKEIQEKYQQEIRRLKDQYERELMEKCQNIKKMSSMVQNLKNTNGEKINEYQYLKTKEQKMLKIIKQMKFLMQNRQKQFDQQLNQLKHQISFKRQKIFYLQQDLKQKNILILQIQSQNNQLCLQIKKLNKQINGIKRQHSRSLSKNQRQLNRQRSMSKVLMKGFQAQKKYLQSQIKKKQNSQKYLLKKQKELLSRIKSMEFEEISEMNKDDDNCGNNVLNQKKLIKNEQKNRSRQNSTIYATPKSLVKLKSNTISVLNSKKEKQNYKKLNQRNLNITNRQNHSTRNSPLHAQNTNHTSSKFTNPFQNSISLCLKDNKYQNKKTVNLNKTEKVKTSKNSSLPSEQSLQINNYSQIDLLKQNFSYFPSTKSSCKNSQQKSSSQKQDNVNLSKQKNSNHLNMLTTLKTNYENQLDHHMRTSFNPNVFPAQHIKNNTQQMGKHLILKKNCQNNQPYVSQFELFPEGEQMNQSKETVPKSNSFVHINKNNKTLNTNNQAQLIQKMLKTQQSNRKNQNSIQILPHNKSEIQQLLMNNDSTQINTTRSTTKMNKKSLPEILTPSSYNFKQSKQNLYKPTKQMLKLSDLDTPCFESSRNTQKSYQDNSFQSIQQRNQKLKINKQQFVLCKQNQSQKLILNINSSNITPQSKNRKVNINIHKMNQRKP